MDRTWAQVAGALRAAGRVYVLSVTLLVRALAGLAGLGVLVMTAVTCVDVLLRRLGRPLTGAYDVVCLASAVTIACALPYTTAVKGHVAIEYFFHKLRRSGRIVVDTLARLAGIALFAVLARQSVAYGQRLRQSGEMMPTLAVPLFWVPYLIAFCCAVVVLVIFHNLTHPGREMIKP